MDKDQFSADYVEFVFQDQYLGRNDMWRLGRDLVGQCLYVEQQVSFIGVIAAKVQTLYIDGQKVNDRSIVVYACSLGLRFLQRMSHQQRRSSTARCQQR